jgi:hypothetical protein
MASTAVAGYQTLLDVVNEYSSMDGGGQLLFVANTLARKVPFIEDAPYIQSNQVISHIGARDAALPSPTARRFNVGVASTAPKSVPYTEPMMMLETYSEIDWALWKIQNDPNRFRQNRDKKYIEGLGQSLENYVIYGNTTTVDPAGINGLATRFNSSITYPNGDSTWKYNVQLAGGSGSDVTSMWVIEWGEDKVHLIYPKNLKAGLDIEDLGKWTSVDSNNLKYEVLRTHFVWWCGLVVHDERCVQRIANIETTGDVNTWDDDLLIQAVNRLPDRGEGGNARIYANRTMLDYFDKAAKDKFNVRYTQDSAGDVWGRNVTRFKGIPVRLAEKILDTETAVS